jgi:hypothetical protein
MDAALDVIAVQARKVRGSLCPVLEIKIRNSGDDAALLKRLELRVMKAAVDVEPRLVFYVDTDDDNNLVVMVANCGWGPALDAEIDNFMNSPIREYLARDPDSYLWRGDIRDDIRIVYSKSEILVERLLEESMEITDGFGRPVYWAGTHDRIIGFAEEATGHVRYRDVSNRRHVQDIRYTDYPLQDYKIALTERGYIVFWRDRCDLFEPSPEHHILLEAGRASYSKAVELSTAIAPHKTKRLHLLVGADKSAFVDARVVLHYGTKRTRASEPIRFHVENPRNYFFGFGRYEGTDLVPEEPSQNREEILEYARNCLRRRIYRSDY